MIDAINDTDIIPAHVALDEPHRIIPCWACRREHTVRLSAVAFNITCECGRFIHVSPPASCGGLPQPPRDGAAASDGSHCGTTVSPAEPAAASAPGILADLQQAGLIIDRAAFTLGANSGPFPTIDIARAADQLEQLAARLKQTIYRRAVSRPELPLVCNGNIETILKEAQS